MLRKILIERTLQSRVWVNHRADLSEVNALETGMSQAGAAPARRPRIERLGAGLGRPGSRCQ